MAYEELKRLAGEVVKAAESDDLQCMATADYDFHSFTSAHEILALIAQNEALERERDTLAEALRPFADMRVLEPNGVIIGLERWHFERARAALGAPND